MNAIDWKTLFISAEGRLARTHFWAAAAVLLGVWALYEAMTEGHPNWRLVTFWMIYPLLAFFAVCIISKRFHDRGRSGWFAAPVMVALIGALGPWRAIDLIFLGAMVWSIVELAVLTGEQGANRFGLNPVRQPV